MDNHFDVDHAKTLLDSLQEERNALNLKQSQSLLSKVDNLQIQEYQMPRTHRIVVLDDVPERKGSYHEALFRLQGVIYERELPPLNETRTRIRLSDAPYLRQHVGITGLGLAYMTDAVDNIHRLYAKFERALQSQDLHPWAADQSCGYNTMEFQQIAGTLPLDGVDPDGVLRRMLGNGIVHTEENTVLYMKANKPDLPNLKWRYQDINPANFSIGDIVEIQFTIMAVRQKQGDYKIIFVLKSLTLLDDSISLAASVSRNKAAVLQMKPMNAANLLKRIHYDDSDDEREVSEEGQVRKNLASLRIRETVSDGPMTSPHDKN
ncbi:hypothetical protein K435DRAFT_804899 [Dendrothele bispora CBS 962.96]|uniref:Uncharacterized protein n=1 Tax=Dendrothele bispora (strain CBS 962.96) TaxID=1314807 RepID=A0A4S8LCQ1_DENBC|nr:hypothetical protein K435DRAFT_804899 [Dendrothele bispora CBS 962.96]